MAANPPPALREHPASGASGPPPANDASNRRRTIDVLVAAELREPVRPGDGPVLRHPPHDLFGLALSGGGIRSATFNLGLLQALGEMKLLPSFDYVSTVSGGGYLGSFWTAWRSRKPQREGRFPGADDVPPDGCEPREVRHLREFSNFLTPRIGIFSYDTGRMLVTAMSSMVPSLLAALSSIALVVLAWALVAWGLFSTVSSDGGSGRGTVPALVIAAVTAAVLVALEAVWRRRKEPGNNFHYVPAAVLGLGATVLAWSQVSKRLPEAAYTGGQALPLLGREQPWTWWLYLLAPAGAWASALLALMLLRWFGSLLVRYPGWDSFHRALDRVRSRLLLLAVAWTAISLLWYAGAILQYLSVANLPEATATGMAGATSALALAFAKVQHLVSKQKNTSSGGKWLSRLKPLLPQILAYAVVVLMALGVVGIIAAGNPGGALAYSPITVAVVAAAITFLVLGLMDPNEVGLHSFYRSRLARAYPGASNDVRSPAAAPVPNRETEPVPGDDLELGTLENGAPRPFHLVCCAANDLASRDDMANLHRGAVSAVLSNHGFSVSGEWAPWSEYRKPPTLGAAVTASGAAFNSLMGSKSIELGPAVTFLAAALNLRLGLWLPHPASPKKRAWKVPGAPFYLEMAGIASASGRHVHLSDGGHFENMGVYELIRRHCRVIVASDCGADPDSAFFDVGNLVRRVRQDFGVDVRIDTSPLRPDERGFSRQHMVAGDIHYPDGDTGVLLIFKPALVGNEPADVLEYRTRNAAFPHETTGDQFYDEAQWESYRRLGEHAGRSAFRGVLARVGLDTGAPAGAAERARWGEVFARARRAWLPASPGSEERLARFGSHVTELDAALRQSTCKLLLNQVYKELGELEARKIAIPGVFRDPAEPTRDAGSRDIGAAGGARQAPAAPVPPTPDELEVSLYLVRRALVLMEEVFSAERLERNYAHPRYLGVMNWAARWAYAPLFRLWWPLLKTLYPESFARFMETHFNLVSVDSGDGVDEHLATSIEKDVDGFARACWLSQGKPAAREGYDGLSYNLRMMYQDTHAYRLQAAQVVARPCDGSAALLWDAEDFFVPPGLWGVGIGTDFLRGLQEQGVPGQPELRQLVVRIGSDPNGGSAAKKRAADEMQLYRTAGFREADLSADGTLYVGDQRVAKLPEDQVQGGSRWTQWMVAGVRVAAAVGGLNR